MAKQTVPGGPLSDSERITIIEIESFERHFGTKEGCFYSSDCSEFIKRDLWSLEARGILRLTRNDDGSHNAFLTYVGRKMFDLGWLHTRRRDR